MLGTTAKMDPWLRKTGLFQNRSREREVRWSFWCSHLGLRSWAFSSFQNPAGWVTGWLWWSWWWWWWPGGGADEPMHGAYSMLFSHSFVSGSSATPWTVACKAPLFMGFPRQGYSSELSFPPPRDLPNPRIEPASPELQVNSLPLSHQGNLLLLHQILF